MHMQFNKLSQFEGVVWCLQLLSLLDVDVHQLNIVQKNAKEMLPPN